MSAEDDIREFYDESPDRGLALSLTAILDNRIESMLFTMTRADEPVRNNLFRPNGALGNFGVKIEVAYLFGLIEVQTREDLQNVVFIRNAFAHRVEVKTFDHPEIRDRVKKLHIYAHMLALRDASPAIDSDAPPHDILKAQILRDELSTTRDSFRMCVRMLIHHLNMLQDGLRALRQSSTETP